MTAQFSERLLFGEKEIPMFSNPLSRYLIENKIQFESPSTANWRGYIGTWEIIEAEGAERLYLVKLHAHKTYEEIVGIPEIFPRFDKVFAHWFTGQLRCPQGAQLEYVHMGYGSTYEYDLLLNFERGVLVNKYARHNHVPKNEQIDPSSVPSFLRKKK